MQRIHDIYRPTEERTRDWREVECMLSDEELKEQTARCMNCGQPFCHRIGLNYVSCSPFRVPIARLAAAQAALRK